VCVRIRAALERVTDTVCEDPACARAAEGWVDDGWMMDDGWMGHLA